jgi:hypothetical protein
MWTSVSGARLSTKATRVLKRKKYWKLPAGRAYSAKTKISSNLKKKKKRRARTHQKYNEH